MIVVFDSGVWISAMQFRGAPFEAVVRAAANHRFAVCSVIEAEVLRVLTRKFGWAMERATRDLSFYWEDALWVGLEGTVTGVCRDPLDEPILECAMRARAACIVSGDKDLLALQSYLGIQILSVRQFLSRTESVL